MSRAVAVMLACISAGAGGADFTDVRARLAQMLGENILPFWLPRVMDAQEGGYRLNHDGQGRWLGPADKYLVAQARCVWFFARLARSRHGAPAHLEAARHGYEFLRSAMWDREHGGFYWAVSSDGTRPVRPDKHLYGQAFGLYALSEYALASGDRDARELAETLFSVLEERAHDRRHGGYRESFQRDWSPVPEGTVNVMGVAGGLKLMNTHLHIMEALTTYLQLTGQPRARDRLLELIVIQSNTVVRKDLGACTDKYAHDWTVRRGGGYDRVSYGHDLENVWLLIEACDAAGLPGALLGDLYRTLFTYSLAHGYDADRGGFYDSGPPGAAADRRAKVWWVQAECLVSALWMYRFTGEARYAQVFFNTLRWIDERQVDWARGDWHNEIGEDGTPRGSKASPWKTPYHNGRAVIRCLELIDAIEAESPAERVDSQGR